MGVELLYMERCLEHLAGMLLKASPKGDPLDTSRWEEAKGQTKDQMGALYHYAGLGMP